MKLDKHFTHTSVIEGEIVAPPLGKDHRPFMDAALAFDFMVIYPLLGDEALMKALTKDNYKEYLKNQVGFLTKKQQKVSSFPKD